MDTYIALWVVIIATNVAWFVVYRVANRIIINQLLTIMEQDGRIAMLENQLAGKECV